MPVNRYFGRCCRCDAAVPPGAGSLTADGDVLCAAHTPESVRRAPRPEMAGELVPGATARPGRDRSKSATARPTWWKPREKS